MPRRTCVHYIYLRRVLVPELLTFAYTPANHLKVNSSTQQQKPREDVYSDYACSAQRASYDESDHVLVLEMDDSMVRKKRLLTDLQVSLRIRSTISLTLSIS
jgi:hypothetical protein